MEAVQPAMTAVEEVSQKIEPVYLVQLGKGKSSYKTRYRFTSWNKAVLYYNALNIGYGYKKRFVIVETGKQIVKARMFS